MTTKKEQNQLSREEKMLRGTAWATFSDFVSKLLGAFYIIPWYIWMGDSAAKANALFTLGYNIYAYFLLLSTMGINVAIARQISKYNALGEEEKALSIVKNFLKIMAFVGIILATILFTGASFFSELSGAGQDLVPILRSLAPAVLAYPVMSVIRGVFWGYNNLKPNSLSQIAEQLIRVIWMLITAFYIMKLGSRDYISAVTQSTFAAFIGMIASLGVLGYYLWKSKLLNRLVRKSKQELTTRENFQLLLTAVKEAAPFIITGSTLQIFTLIDQGSFINSLLRFTSHSREQLTILYSYASANPSKIIMIIISVAGSIGSMGTVLLTESYTQKDDRGTARLIINAFQMLFVFIIPAIMGASILADSLYGIFYGSSEPIAIWLFIALLFQTFLVSIYMILAPMLHSISESKKAIVYTGYGLLLKLIIQLPCFYIFHSFAPVISSGLAFLLSIILMYRHLHRVTRFNHRIIVKHTLTTILISGLMLLLVSIFRLGLSFFVPLESRLDFLIYLLFCGGAGFILYAYLALKTRSIDQLLGNRSEQLRQKFNIS